MTPPLLELEGTAEEIQHRLADFAGQRLHVTVRPVETPAEETPETPPRKLTIEEKILARAMQTPPEERAKIPTDLAENLDHYIYGWPKK
jgi:hypothetical protein